MITTESLPDSRLARVLLDLSKMPLDIRYGPMMLQHVAELFDADVTTASVWYPATGRAERLVHSATKEPDAETVWANPWLEDYQRILRSEPVDKLLYFKHDDAVINQLKSVTDANLIVTRSQLNDEAESYFSIYRMPGRPHFRRPDVTLFRTLQPFVRNAIRLHQEMLRASLIRNAADNSRMLNLSDSMIIMHDGGIRWAGSHVREVFQHCRLFSFQNGVIELSSPHRRTEFFDCINRVSASNADQTAVRMEVPARGDSPAMTLTFFPHCVENDERFDPAPERGALIMVQVDERSETLALVRRNAAPFGFTRAEAAVLESLCLGESISQMAERTQRSRETIRSLLKRVFKKAGVNRQSELVASMLREA